MFASELEMGGHPVPKSVSHSNGNSAHLVLDVLIKKVCPAPPTSATVIIVLSTWEGYREASPHSWPSEGMI